MSPRLLLISLGCPKNRVESEKALAQLERSGFHFVDRLEDADVALLNSCAFLPEAREETTEVLDALQTWRQEAEGRSIVVMGCWPLYEEGTICGADVTVQGHNPEDVLRGCLKAIHQDNASVREGTLRLLTTPASYAYLSIGNGCDGGCTFCSIPSFRGPYQSVSEEDLVAEGEGLLQAGVREIVLVAQDVAYYGKDLGLVGGLSHLLVELCHLKSAPFWVRLLYCHPSHFESEIIDLFQNLDPLVPYVDLPIQHASPSVLRAMGRDPDIDAVRRLVSNLNKVPGMTIRTTVMTGFPGETDQDFEILMDFLEETDIQHVGVFCYSDEPRASSFRMRNKVPASLGEERAAQVRERAASWAGKRHRKRVGSVETVLVDAECENSVYEARSQAEAPEVDPVVLIQGEPGSLEIGEFYRIQIVEGHAGYLQGVMYQG